MAAEANRETVEVINAHGKGDYLLVCEHASRFIPAEFNNLGLADDALISHIAWDPGALAVAKRMSEILDAPLVAQKVSRLVYDCNRPPEAPSAMPEKSEIFDVPRNVNLTQSQRDERTTRFYDPFRQMLTREIDRKVKGQRPPVVITMHSFTRVYNGVDRPVEIGILHDADTRLADALLKRLEGQTTYDIRRNSPYGPEDGVTHTLKLHALPNQLPNIMVEIRNDLISSPENQAKIAELLSKHVAAACDKLHS